MQKTVIYIFKILKFAKTKIISLLDSFFTWFIFYINGVKFSSYKTYGLPRINVSIGGKCVIGSNFTMNNREMANPIGRFNRCSIIVSSNANLDIGNNVGISSTAIVCHSNIKIGDNVKIGGNVVIYDTDFHSLHSEDRLNRDIDIKETKTKPIIIGNNAFIGAHTTILKGVTIGDNSIIGACSVVTKSIPNNEIWAGNPAKLIKKLNYIDNIK